MQSNDQAQVQVLVTEFLSSCHKQLQEVVPLNRATLVFSSLIYVLSLNRQVQLDSNF